LFGFHNGFNPLCTANLFNEPLARLIFEFERVPYHKKQAIPVLYCVNTVYSGIGKELTYLFKYELTHEIEFLVPYITNSIFHIFIPQGKLSILLDLISLKQCSGYGFGVCVIDWPPGFGPVNPKSPDPY
jgi:hypothetical protein